MVAQILLIREDLDNRKTYLNARSTLHGLLENRVIPIVNENDVVTAGSFGGNDMLAAAIAGLIDADLLLLLTNVDGVYPSWPKTETSGNPYSQLTVTEIDNILLATSQSKISDLGTGGISAKLEAARLAANFGIPTIIANGTQERILEDIVFNRRSFGTFCLPALTRLEARKRWILYGIKPRGRIIIDDGAEDALINNGTSLLPVGVRSIEGLFVRGDAVQIFSQKSNTIIAYGLTNYDSKHAQQIAGKHSHEIMNLFPAAYERELIHRDNLVVV